MASRSLSHGLNFLFPPSIVISMYEMCLYIYIYIYMCVCVCVCVGGGGGGGFKFFIALSFTNLSAFYK